MNNKELEAKVNSAIYCQIKNRGFATIVDTLISIGYLTDKDYQAWKNGNIFYLERVCKTNLSKLSLIVRTFRNYGKKDNHYFSRSTYVCKRTKQKLRFTKTNNPHLEELYSTHIVLRKDSNSHSEM